MSEKSPDAAANKPANKSAQTPLEKPRAKAPSSAKPRLEQSATQRNNPLHGITLQTIVSELHDYYGGWQGLAKKAPLNCFKNNPTVKSALTFLRKTPWAREKVEQLYLFTQREIQRGQRNKPRSPVPPKD
ncbi:MAG: DUF2132 domain-containing protein [Thiotrichales bacterium]|nr:DUF2132 domain-containing protein [Thiotrichales bacterium]